MRGKILLWGVVLALVLGGGAPAAGETYCNYYDHDGTWNDVNKTWIDDSEMCWAATASNILAWSGWGTARYSTAGGIYDYIRSCFPNFASDPYQDYDFWFNGRRGEGGFYPGYGLNNYHNSGSPMQDLATFLHAGQGVHIRATLSGYAHALTVWGYDYNPAYTPDDNGYYTHLYYTDSDDRVTELQCSAISRNEAGHWVFNEGRLANWRIEGCTGLERDPFIDLPAYHWVGQEALEGSFDLMMFLSFDYRWEPPFPDPDPNDPCLFMVQIETENGWEVIYQLALEQSEMGWQSLNIPLGQEFMGLQKLRFPVDGEAQISLYRLHMVPLPGALWLLGSGLLGLAAAGWRRRRRH